jgi:Icc-related predicted phosphoesterase
MKLHILSDLHLEMGDYTPAVPAADLVILAGDIHKGALAVRWARQAYPQLPVLLVPGNHEYYGSTIQAVQKEMREAALGTKVAILDNNSATIDGVRFIGTTLWTDFRLFSADPAIGMSHARDAMSDYRVIRTEPDKRRLRPEDSAAMHAASLRWLVSELAKPCNGPTVVITHHCPALGSCDPRFHDDPLCPAFASDLGKLIMSSQVRLWVDGHTHYNHDYALGPTRIISNQRGYPREVVPGFDPELVIEL